MKPSTERLVEIQHRRSAIARLRELATRGSISDVVRERCHWSIANLKAAILALRGGHE